MHVGCSAGRRRSVDATHTATGRGDAAPTEGLAGTDSPLSCLDPCGTLLGLSAHPSLLRGREV